MDIMLSSLLVRLMSKLQSILSFIFSAICTLEHKNCMEVVSAVLLPYYYRFGSFPAVLIYVSVIMYGTCMHVYKR